MHDRPALRESIRQMGWVDQSELTLHVAPRGVGVRLALVRMAAVRVESSGPLVGIRWVFRDVTQARAAEEEIVANREKLRELTSELSLAEERVRREIAVGIHDRVSQPARSRKNRGGKDSVRNEWSRKPRL